jgi:tetraacyldisaccharide 4'-kinase
VLALQQFIERIWYQGHKGYWLLLPFAWLYGAITKLRRGLYRFKLKKQLQVAVPVIVVGNISVGGTGKTPFTLLLCQLLRQHGWQPGIISRGYGADITAPTLVQPDATARDVGDEPLLLAQRSGCPVVVCPDRVAAAQFLLTQRRCDIIVSDDGLQHYRLARNVEIVLIDGNRGLGNGQLLPAGPLREGRWRLKQVDMVVANSKTIDGAEGVMQLQAALPQPLIGSAVLPNGAAVTLVAGIGNPQRFEQTAKAAGFHITERRFVADHYQFSAADFADINGPVLMTEKDAVKCRRFARPDWFCLPVAAVLDDKLINKITTILTNLRSSYGN